MIHPHLTDERIEQIERTQTYEFVTQLIHDLRLYKQQAEERGKALEFYANPQTWRLQNVKGFWQSSAHDDCGDIARKAIGEEQPNE